MDHQGAIGRHELADSHRRIGLQRRIEGEHPVVDHGIDGIAEFDDEGGLSRIEKAWRGRRRCRIERPCHVAVGLNDLSEIPASSNRSRTRRAVATAWSESPWTQIERI